MNENIEKELNAHIWKREDYDHYVEPEWCSIRLFEEDEFLYSIYDPACGFGNILKSAQSKGLQTLGSDIIHRSDHCMAIRNFLDGDIFRYDNIVTNPPFNLAYTFAFEALRISNLKVAMIFPVARLNAARWLEGTPLRRIWLLTPRPSMPPGDVIARGEKPTGGKVDFCWLVWDKMYNGNTEIKWLKRDK